MNVYNPVLEDFVDGVDFGPNDPCTWVVYPSGCGGDLLASIINFHYIETGARYKGIAPNGRVMFRSSDMKLSNQQMQNGTLKFDNQFFYSIADSLSERHLNWAKMDHFIFANHCFTDKYVQMILDAFANCKIVRLLPGTYGEYEIMEWMAKFKNLSHDPTPLVLSRNADVKITQWTEWADPRVLTVFFGDFINQKKFKETYYKIQQHQNFVGSMITYDFVQFWIDQQHPEIQKHINRLAKY